MDLIRTLRSGAAPIGFALAMVCGAGALAQSSAPAAAPAATAAPAPAPTLLGDIGGLRPALARYGMTLTLVEQSEILGNVSGGRRQGFEYDGLATATLQLDTLRAFGLYGGLFDLSGLQIHGRNLSADNLLTLQTASGVEADRATRLWELWYQQKLFDDRLDFKIGQQSLDQEFMVSQNALLFVNTAFGWPMLPTADLPGGGPAYPLSALGLRARAQVTDSVTVLGGVFNGSPVADNFGDPQKQNPSGVSFPLNGGTFAIAELQFASPAAKAGEPAALAGAYKIGAWYDAEGLPDLRRDRAGLSLADPASDGIAATRRGDYALYAVADQMIYRFADDPDRNVSLFVRPMVTPLQDRNLIAFSLNAGLTMHAPFVERHDDTAGFGVSFARIGDGATGFDLDRAFYDPGVASPVRRNETVLEATYQFQVAPWWQIQPDLQYAITPGGGVADPDHPGRRIGNETVLGVRTNITF